LGANVRGLMLLVLVLLALTFIVGFLGLGLRWYYSEPQIKRREGQRRILGQYKRW